MGSLRSTHPTGTDHSHYNARAALPLNRIGPVGRPIGEPPSGSSVISNSWSATVSGSDF